MSGYRDTNYTLYTVSNLKPKDYYQQCKLAHEQETMWRWVNVIFIPKVFETFLEFKDENDKWDGKSWRVIQIMPRLRLEQVVEMQKHDKTIVIVDEKSVRDYLKWNKK